MTWNELIDRCLLYTSSSRDMLRELMKEAEEELCTRLEIYDSLYEITVPATTSGMGVEHTLTEANADHNYMALPDEYIKDNYVLCNGKYLKKITEADIYRDNSNQVSPGEPTGYTISGDFIIFDKIPDTGDNIVLSYKSTLDKYTNNKIFTILEVDSGNNYIYLNTDIATELNGLTVICGVTSQTLASGAMSTVGTYLGSIDRTHSNVISVISNTPNKIARYTLSSATNFIEGSLAMVVNYRSIAPLIPKRFHTSLCDYAIAIASVKSNPVLYDTHWNKWLGQLERHINEGQDRDLIHSVREVL
tara:strand:+ start:5696 stop:6607 length:912 start_codon:yes stop_codon:yes gene_type:complete